MLREKLSSAKLLVTEKFLTFYLKSGKLVVDLFELTFVVVEPSLLG